MRCPHAHILRPRRWDHRTLIHHRILLRDHDQCPSSMNRALTALQNFLTHHRTPLMDHDQWPSSMNHALRALSNFLTHHRITLMDRDLCPSRTNHALRAQPKILPLHPHSPIIHRGRRKRFARQYHVKPSPIVGPIHGHKIPLQSP